MNATVERRTLLIRADQLVPGLYVTSEWVGDDGELHQRPPLRITAMERTAEEVTLSFDNGWRVRYEPGEQVEMAIVPGPEPAWCVDHSVDGDGSVRHAAAGEFLTVADRETGSVEYYVVLSRWDDPDGTIAEPASVSVVVDGHIGVDLTPAQARELAGMLARLADLAEDTTTVEVK